MTARQQWTVVGTVILVLGVGLLVASRSMKAQLFPVSVGARAPNFQAKDLATGRMKTLADYKGQVVLLNIWATYCDPCRAEIPSLEKLYKEYGSHGLKILAVSIDDAVSEDSIRAFARQYGVTFDVLHAPLGTIDATYQTTGIPETFVIGPEGTIRRKWIGADDWSSPGNQALVAQLLGMQTPQPVAEVGDR